jgi:hypothetical protein
MRRYERASTLLTSNRPVEDWGKLIGDSAAVTAMLDRLLHDGYLLNADRAAGGRRPMRLSINITTFAWPVNQRFVCERCSPRLLSPRSLSCAHIAVDLAVIPHLGEILATGVVPTPEIHRASPGVGVWRFAILVLVLVSAAIVRSAIATHLDGFTIDEP